MSTRRRGGRLWQLLAILLVFSLFAAACGDDDDDDAGTVTDDGVVDDGTADDATDDTDDDGTADDDAADDAPDGEPEVGGEATILLFSEVGTLDPVSSTGSGGSDAQRFFPIYGAIVTMDIDEGGILNYFAESFEANDDYTQWTLTLVDGIVFSDGTPYDAEAVKTNWERLQDPDNRSPSIGIARSIESMEADGNVLTINLVAANAHFPNSVSRVGGMNYIASPTAIADGHDLVNDPVGAGPFLMANWIRDDRMILERNPDFVFAPRPYLDRITLRVVGDEQQRIDTFGTGDADAFYTSTPGSVVAAENTGRAAGYASVEVGSGQTFVFNNAAPPFDDPRVRRAFVVGVDHQALVDIVFGEGAVAATNFSKEPFFTEDGAIPGYDPDEAQELFSEAAADAGGEIVIELQGFQQTLDQRRVEFVQSQLNQYDGVRVNVTINDSPTSIGNVLQGDFQVSSWGFPWEDPVPGWYNAMRSELPTNYARYSDPEVDEALDIALTTSDFDTRKEQYDITFAAAARDLPFWPYVDTVNGFVYSNRLQGADVWQDGILRFDELWVAS